MRGLAIILFFNFAGVILHEQAHVPLPASVLGFALLTVALFTGVVRLEWVEDTAELLIRHLPLFFSPSIVVGVALFPQVAHEWPAVVIGMIGSTAVTLLLTGGGVQLVALKCGSGPAGKGGRCRS